MTVSVRDLMRRACGAFRSGDIADTGTLKDAMAWLNFQNSAACRQVVADAFHRLDSDGLSGLPGCPARPSDVNDYCRGIPTNGMARFHWVDVLQKDAAAKLPHDISIRNLAQFRRSLMNMAEARIRSKRGAILWLAELDEAHFKNTKPLDLLAGLGRYGQALKTDEVTVIYTIEVQRVHKPTMIDAGFTFYWLSWPDDATHGMTLGLSNGQPTYKEWVVPKDDVKVVDAWSLMAGTGSLTDGQLPVAYWDAGRERVAKRRNI